MKLIQLIAMVSVCFSPVLWKEQAPTVHHYPEAKDSLANKWAWALDKAEGVAHVGWPLTAKLPATHWVLGASTINLSSGRLIIEGIPLARLLKGETERETRTITSEELQGNRLVDHQLGLLFEIHKRGKKVRIVKVKVTEMALPVDLEGPLYWLGPTTREESFEILNGQYKDASNALREDIVDVVGYHQISPARTFLERVLASDAIDPIRAEAVESLADQGDEALPAIIGAARNDRSITVRCEAVETLGDVASAEAEQALLKLIPKSPVPVRAEIAESLAGFSSERARQALEQLLWHDESEDVNDEALEAFVSRGNPGKLLREVIAKHPRLGIRGEALEWLAETEKEQALPLLDTTLFGSEEELSILALNALERLPAETAFPLLRRVIEKHKNKEMRYEAVSYLSSFPSEQVKELLLELSRHPDSRMSEQALETLSELPDGEGGSALRNLLLEFKNN